MMYSGKAVLRAVVAAGIFLCMCVISAPARASQIDVIEISDPITPVVAEYILRSISEAEQDRVLCLIIQLDTPGGLDLAMRDIIKRIMSSEVPVVVFVGPSGARAASAGALITLAAHVAAMAPGTNIGAAHPVNLGGQMDETMTAKVANDAAAYIESIAEKRGRNKQWAINAVRESVSISETEALSENVIDLIAEDLNDLIRKIDGREIEMPSGPVTLESEGATVNRKTMGFRDIVLKALANPNIAYILFMAGLAGLYFEFSNPGAIFPGVIGGISIILAMYSMQSLSANYAGVLMILVAVVLFILEIKVTSFGLLALGGIVALTLGSLMLFDSSVPYMRVSLSVIVPTVALVSSVFLLAIWLVINAQRSKPTTGREGMLNLTGEASTDIAEQGRVFVHGEYWNARSETPIPKGVRVRVIKVDGMLLTVQPEHDSLQKNSLPR
jgi:membrane-bound serine protease (ClpP class)